MKPLKSTATRSALTLVAGCAALALTGCGAGQISQTADQVPAVNGTNGEAGDAMVRDVSLIIQKDDSVVLKFNASNQAIQEGPVTLSSVKIQDATFNLGGAKTIDSKCNLVVDSAQSLREMRAEKNKSTCTEYLASTVEGSGFFPGDSRNVTFTFNTGDIQVSAPVVTYAPEAGSVTRGADGVTKDNT